jgi:16S rRNA (guanine966-N2)-methyltransferase
MRIISGQFKGRPIIAPKTKNTRPTSDRARESLFNILSHAAWAPYFEGARVLDVFAGSGALGLEAISRGATYCLFVETAHAARGAIRDNIETLGLTGKTKIYRRSAIDLGARSGFEPFDLIFMDPPYNKGLVELCLRGLVDGGWLADDALIVVETAADEQPDFSGWQIHADRKIGAARVWFIRRD